MCAFDKWGENVCALSLSHVNLTFAMSENSLRLMLFVILKLTENKVSCITCIL